jgi:hypothetical protein
MASDDPGQPPPSQYTPVLRRHFAKRLGDQHLGFIGLERYTYQPQLRVNAQGVTLRQLGVLIARKPSLNPYAEIDPADTRSLHGWLVPGAQTRADIKATLSEAGLWEYVEAALALQLAAILDKLERVGIPILEGG